MNIFLILSLFLVVGCPSSQGSEGLVGNKDNIIFKYENSFTSPYIPPIYEDLRMVGFNIKGINIYTLEEDYLLKITMDRPIIQGSDISLRWENILFDIYVNTGKGKHKHTMKDRNVKLKGGWDKAILLSPANNFLNEKEVHRSRKVYDDFSVVEDLVPDISIAKDIKVEGDSIYVRLEKSVVEKICGIQVFVMGIGIEEGDDGKSIDLFKVKELPTSNSFGGGVSNAASPNIAHLLGPVGKLNSFEVSAHRVKFAEVDMVEVNEEKDI